MISKLDLYILNSDNSVAPFPSEAEQIVLYNFAFEAQRMGSAPEITASIQANGSLENALTTKVFCEYNGERYFLKNLPSSSKENTNPQYTFDLTFVSERTILDNVYMIDAVQGDSNIDRYQSNSTNIVFMDTIEELIARLNASMIYTGVGYSVVLDEGIATESKLVSFQDKVFTEALQEGVKIFNVPYYYVGKIIHFGYSQTTIPTLKYGDGLLSINKSIRTERIVNRATATGSTENIPYYYPNPTPKGFINPSIIDKSGAGISVINEAKLSRLSEGKSLAYYEFPEVEVIDTYFSEDYNTVIPPYVPVFDWDKKNVKYGNVRPFNMSYLISGLSVKSTKDETMDVFINFYLSYASSAAKYVEFKDVIAYVKEGDALIIDTSLHPQISGGGILIPDFPTNAERYIAVIYYNNSYNTYRFDFNFSSNYYLSSGWYISDGNDRINDSEVNIFDYGVSVSNTPKEGDEVSYKVIKKIPFATTLMPPIYRETDGAQRFYNAINGAYEGVTFENEYSEVNPKEAITKFEDIKPTIVGVTNANGERIDMFAEFAYDLNDSDETEQTSESSESFIHPYFYAKLRKIDGNNGFNLFAQAIESGEMTIEMTSGHCGACKFVIAVDENTQRNLVMVDNNGDLIYDEATGKVQMANDATGLDRQNDTRNYEVWIALKKDISTYGHIMPMANSTIKPNVNDTFVITNILLPQAYFTAAEKKLEGEIIAFLVKNNVFQFDYGINFSRIFLKKRNDVLSALSENALIPIEYNGKKLSFYVSSYTYRKQKGEVLPEISVSLTDNLESTPSTFQQTISAIQENIVKGTGAAGLTFEDTDPRYLRKDVADTVKERITFDKGLDFRGSLTSKGFKKGNLDGSGFGVYEDEAGNTVVEADRMIIREDAQFSEIVINQTTFQLGTTVFSGGGCNITNVEEVEGAYRCYYDNKSSTRFSGFVVGDQARCQRFDESFGGVIKYYWRLVVAVGSDYVDLSKTDVDGGGVPESGDDIVQLGHRTNADRQNAILISSYPRPTIVQYIGINSFTLPEPSTVISPDKNLFTGKAVFEAGSSGLENLEEWAEKQEQIDKNSQDVETLIRDYGNIKGYVDTVAAGLQHQIDGAIDSYFFKYEPSTDNVPASEWTTTEQKEAHLNDTFTNLSDGRSWRWSKDGSTYSWVEIADTATAEALKKAGEAQEAADGKMRVFIEQPVPPYQVGDLWAAGENQPLRRCVKSSTSENFDASDWALADNAQSYADSIKTSLEKSISTNKGELEEAIKAAKRDANSYTDDAKEAIEASISALDQTYAKIENVYNKAEVDDGISDAEQRAISAAGDATNAALTLYDITIKAWADGEIDTAEQNAINEAQKRLDSATEALNGAIYDLDQDLDAFRIEYNNTINRIENQLDKKADTWYQASDPSQNWVSADEKQEHIGDLWYNTTAGQSFMWDGSTWVTQGVPDEVFDTIDGKSSIFVLKPEAYRANDIWVLEKDYDLSESYVKGTWVVALQTSDTFEPTHWKKLDTYADKEYINSLETGSTNLLRNSGFTGDYISTNLKENTSLNNGSQMFSPSLQHWGTSDVIAQESEVSQSGVEVVISNGVMAQTLKVPLLKGEKYIFSFRGKGEYISYEIGGNTNTITLNGSWNKYVERFVATSDSTIFTISGNATLCELQLTHGDIVSAWSPSVWDNSSELAYYQTLQYLSNAIKNGSTTFQGGLVLSNILLMGNVNDDVLEKNTAGVSGVYSDDTDVAFWAGGTMAQAIRLVQLMTENPNYQPTDAEWETLAKFAATHGGDIFMRGYIYAMGGLFKGTVSIANGKILLNADGSGRLSNGALEWDKEGRLYKNFPDMIRWRSLKNTTINYSLGGYYIAESNTVKTLSLGTPPVTPYRLVLKAADVITPENKNVTIATSDGAQFFYADPNDANTFYSGSYLTITTSNNSAKGMIEITRDGGIWDIFVPSSMTVGGVGTVSDVLIF